MIQSILVPKIVYQALLSNSDLAQKIGNRVFPLVADFGTVFPYVAYSKTYITPLYTKDFYTEDSVGIEIVVAATDYLESLEIANIVRSIFECKKLRTEDLSISQITFSGISEGYDDSAGAFVQRLTFEFKVN